jgi:hypothetical protein
MLAGRCIVLYGPAPVLIFAPPTWSELEQALYGELRFVENVLADHPDYCILNLCRLIYSFQTREVVISKMAAAAWAAAAFAEWSLLIEAAKRSYARLADPEDIQLMHDQVKLFLQFARCKIDPVSPDSN